MQVRTGAGVPPPLPLSSYVDAVERWLDGRRTEPEFVATLLAPLAWNDALRLRIRRSVSALRSEASSLELGDLAGLALSSGAAEMLALIVLLRGRHQLEFAPALRGQGRLPPALDPTEEALKSVRLVLGAPTNEAQEQAHRWMDALQRDLSLRIGDDPGPDLRARGKSLVTKTLDGVRQAPGGGGEAVTRLRRALRSGGPARLQISLLLTLGLLALLAGGILVARGLMAGRELTPISSFKDLPVLAVIPSHDSVTVRLERAWFDTAGEGEDAAIILLWDAYDTSDARFSLILQDSEGHNRRELRSEEIAALREAAKQGP